MSNLKFDYLEPGIMNTHSKLRCDYVVSFISLVVVEKMKKRGIKKEQVLTKSLTTKTWYLGRIYKMRGKIGNMWIEYQQLIDLQTCLSNLEIG